MARRSTAGAKTEMLPVDQIHFDPSNPRKHSDHNLQVIENSMRDLGFARSIVIDENNQLLAGEGATRGAQRAGLEKVMVVEADGDTIVAVRRRNLTEEQKDKLKIVDNRANELSEWNYDMLRDSLSKYSENLESLEMSTGFSLTELNALLDTEYKPGLSDSDKQQLDQIHNIFNGMKIIFDAKQAKVLKKFDQQYKDGETLAEKIIHLIKAL